jgi:hypothetical protein
MIRAMANHGRPRAGRASKTAVRPGLLALLALLLAPGLLGGCGEADVGGAGELLPVGGGGAGDHLVLTGTPYEMGWWHGRLLRDRIRALHEDWQRRVFALDGDLLSPATKARRAAALALVEPVLEKHLPEDVRREYDGLAAGCGLPVRTLVLTEMLTDVLRFTEPTPRLLVGAHLRDRNRVLLVPDGPWRDLLADEWVWITRRPTGSARGTTVLAWPGSLGAVLAARADGVLALATAASVDPGREGLAGVPFRVSLRRAVERGADPAAVLAALARTTAHGALALDLAKDAGLSQLVALVGDDPVTLPPGQDDEGRGTWHRRYPMEAPAQFGADWRDGALRVSTWESGPGLAPRRVGEIRVP